MQETRRPTKSRSRHDARVGDSTQPPQDEETTTDRPTAPPGEVKEAMLPELRRLFIAGDYETVLPLAESVLSARPDEEVKAIVETSRAQLADHYAMRLGRLSRVPTLKVPQARWKDLALEPRECFVLNHVDDLSTLQMIVDSSGLSRHEVLRSLCDLLERGIIAM